MSYLYGIIADVLINFGMFLNNVFFPMCDIQIKAELDVSPLIYVAPRFCH